MDEGVPHTQSGSLSSAILSDQVDSGRWFVAGKLAKSLRLLAMQLHQLVDRTQHILKPIGRLLIQFFDEFR